MNLYVARQSGTVMLPGPDGRPRRYPIRRGVTVAEEGSDMMNRHGRLFEPLRVHHRASDRKSRRSVETATAAPGELRNVSTPEATAEPETGPRAADVRRWAREQGIEVSARGKVSPEVVAAYEAAQEADDGGAGDANR